MQHLLRLTVTSAERTVQLKMIDVVQKGTSDGEENVLQTIKYLKRAESNNVNDLL